MTVRYRAPALPYSGHITALASGKFRAMVRWNRQRIYTKSYPTLAEAEAARDAMLAVAAEYAPGFRPPPPLGKTHWQGLLDKARAEGHSTMYLQACPSGIRVRFRHGGEYLDFGVFRDILEALIFRNFTLLEHGKSPV